MIGQVEVPEELPKEPAKSPTDSRPQPSFGPCRSTKAIVSRSKDEPNPGESATLPSPPTFMLVADTGFRRICI